LTSFVLTLRASLGNIERAVCCGKHVEIVTNVMPGVNDVDLEAIADFIKSLNPEIPWHLTRFFPQFKMQNVPPTPVSLLTRARQMALEKGLKYVYLENTVCPRCGNLFCSQLKTMLSKAAVPAAAIKYMEDLEVEGETEAYFSSSWDLWLLTWALWRLNSTFLWV